jgi:citrate lyase subunit beta / citryl-CoA lyase
MTEDPAMTVPTASAGYHGADVRSDCRVMVWHATDGPPTIEIRSKVEVLYGDSIRELTRATLKMLDAADLSLSLDDSGALPYVLQARIEAAVRRLKPDTVGTALSDINPARQAAARPGLRRSRLYLPGNTPKFFINAGLHRPDAIILDLEDSVPPSERDAARLLVRNALRSVDFYSAEKMVRVNAPPNGLDDVRALMEHGVDTFLLPKVEDAEAVRVAADLLDQLDRPEIALIPIVESARGVLNACAIASASPRVVALAIGLEDYTADIGVQRTSTGRESLWAQSQIVNAARAARVQPLASVYSAIDDEAGLREWLIETRGLGFSGAGCLHPRQIRVIHAAFAPSPAEIEQARRIVQAFEGAQADHIGVVAVDGRMVDAPVVARARRILQLAESD